jgi:phospholipid/cholesterol/gamma-HCH transport system ATP-binding protein
MITIKEIQKGFSGKSVIEGVSSEFETGKCNLIIGSSGSGKTVLMKCLVGLITPDSGEIIYDGENFSVMNTDQKKIMRRKIGMLFQGSALFDSMTVEKNILFPLEMFSNPAEISGVMKKRVGIARAIVLNPQYLFCDEPNSGLDPQTSLVIDKLIKEITTDYNITTVINTHDMNSVMEIGDKIMYMYQGKKEWEGTNKEIIFSKSEKLNSFIFASEFLKDAKDMRMLEMKGKIDNQRDMDKMLE